MKKVADIFILAAGILWGTAGILVSHMKNIGFSPIQISALRWIFSGAIMFVSVLIVSPNKLRINFRDIWWFLCTGILCILLSSTLYFVSIPLTTSAIANVLMYTSPIWILIFSIIFFKEKITFKCVVGIIIALGAIVAMSL